jgi:hypothetical protein
MSNEGSRVVQFIHTEINDDLIISFALCIADDPTDVESLTLLRTPKYEVLLEEQDRGVKVSFELEDEGFLKEFAFDRAAGTVHLRTSKSTFKVDVRRVTTVDITEMLKILMLMNFDSRLKISGLE